MAGISSTRDVKRSISFPRTTHPSNTVYFGHMVSNLSLCIPHFDVPGLSARMIVEGYLLRRGHLGEINDSSYGDQQIKTQEDVYASEFTHYGEIIVM